MSSSIWICILGHCKMLYIYIYHVWKCMQIWKSVGKVVKVTLKPVTSASTVKKVETGRWTCIVANESNTNSGRYIHGCHCVTAKNIIWGRVRDLLLQWTETQIQELGDPLMPLTRASSASVHTDYLLSMEWNFCVSVSSLSSRRFGYAFTGNSVFVCGHYMYTNVYSWTI